MLKSIVKKISLILVFVLITNLFSLSIAADDASQQIFMYLNGSKYLMFMSDDNNPQARIELISLDIEDKSSGSESLKTGDIVEAIGLYDDVMETYPPTYTTQSVKYIGQATEKQLSDGFAYYEQTQIELSNGDKEYVIKQVYEEFSEYKQYFKHWDEYMNTSDDVTVEQPVEAYYAAES